jgi:hypothetical protein
MFRNPVLICCVALIVGLFGLVQVKMYVHQLYKEVSGLELQKGNLENEIKVLSTEWTYLNRAERLQNLGRKYLNMNEETEIIYNINEFNQEKIIPKVEKKEIKRVIWKYKSREQIFRKIKGLKTMNNHSIVRVKN